MSSSDHELAFNGINGSTGRPLVPALSPETVGRLACGEKWDLEHLVELKEQKERMEEDDMGLIFGESAKLLQESGWGVIFPHDVSEEIEQAVKPLLEHRRREATRSHADLFKKLVYRPGESKSKFLARYDVGPGPVNPHQLPYYLLIVGGPEQIPFYFQYQLDVQYAVGRIHFPTPEGYAHYANSVVAAEKGAFRRSRRVALFGVANPDDKATGRSLQNLIEPLAEQLRRTWSQVEPSTQQVWQLETVSGAEATKASLGRLLGGEATPALLLTASHGMGFDTDDPRFPRHQGALLCQDWPGPRLWRDPIPTDHYFCCDDVAAGADLAGLITFHFACYGAGTPKFDDFAHRDSARRQLAPESFVASLPQRLLAHPGGGALAVIGHIDRAWSYSFDWKDTPRQLNVFSSAFGSLFDGYPVGAAMEYFNQRYAELSADLSSEIENVNYGRETDFLSLSGMWTANNDARSYVVIGDPAVRLVSA